MKKFDSESAKNEFKDLCTEILPVIGNIEQILKREGVTDGVSIKVRTGGYLSMDVYNSMWRMSRYQNDGPVKIFYEYSEEISIPDSRQLDKVSENLVEISMTFANMQTTHSVLCKIDSTEWKRQFIEWANEFESQWKEDEGRDYLEEINRFARKKIVEYVRRLAE